MPGAHVTRDDENDMESIQHSAVGVFEFDELRGEYRAYMFTRE